MIRNWLAIALSFGTAAAVVTGMGRVRRRREEKRALKTEVRKWEDEGGNIPHVPTVSPVVTPTSSTPATGGTAPGVRADR